MKDLHFSRYPCRRRMQVFHGIIWRAVYQQLRIKRKKLPSMMSILFWWASFEIDSRQQWCVLLDAKLFEEMTTCFVFPTVFKAAVDADYSIFTHCYSPSESVFLYMRVESDVVFFFSARLHVWNYPPSTAVWANVTSCFFFSNCITNSNNIDEEWCTAVTSYKEEVELGTLDCYFDSIRVLRKK